MRLVLKSTSEVFHYWANQIQLEGKSGNVRFDGAVVYSYAEPIGRLFHDSRIALLSNRKWSITTSGHQSAARSAIPGGWRVVYAPYVGSYGEPHRDNKDYWERAFIGKLNMIKAHPRRKSLLSEANSVRHQYDTYREVFGLDWPELNAEELGAKLEAEQREAAKRAEQYAKEQEERRLARVAEQAENLAKWRVHDFAGTSHYFETTALRLSKDGNHIETTRGAEVPVEVAGMLWRLACSCRRRGTAYVPTVGVKVGVYTLDRVKADGSLVIGCHNITWDELVLMADTLGFAAYSDTHDITQEKEADNDAPQIAA